MIAEIGAIPHFSRHLYDSEPVGSEKTWLEKLFGRKEPESGFSEEKSFKVLNAAFEADLAALPKDIWQPGNLIVAPGLCQHQILGLVRHLRSIPEACRPKVVCQLMFTPSWLPWGVNAKHGKNFYRQSFKCAAPIIGRDLFFTVENKAMQDYYRKMFRIETQILPIPFGGGRRKELNNSKFHLGFFGNSKRDKGFHLLPRALEICREKALDFDITIQIQHNHWEPATIAADCALRSMPGIRLLDGILDSDQYLEEAHKIDVMLLPYDPATFGFRGSGIFTESVSAGRVIIATKGTFAGRSVELGEAAGVTFSPHGSAQLAAAIQRLLPRMPQYKAQAMALAENFGQRHSGHAYLDVLLDIGRA
jgi:glycosyltransferase involved in cell wall biosynthesis